MSMAFRRFVEEQGIPPERHAEAAAEFCRTDTGTFTHVKQADKGEYDVNTIVRRNLAQGILPMSQKVPVYADISEIPSLQEALAVMDKARDDFYALGSKVREAFGNDPRAFVAAAQDPTKADLFRSLGLIPAIEAPAVAGASGGTVPS